MFRSKKIGKVWRRKCIPKKGLKSIKLTFIYLAKVEKMFCGFIDILTLKVAYFRFCFHFEPIRSGMTCIYFAKIKVKAMKRKSWNWNSRKGLILVSSVSLWILFDHLIQERKYFLSIASIQLLCLIHLVTEQTKLSTSTMCVFNEIFSILMIDFKYFPSKYWILGDS